MFKKASRGERKGYPFSPVKIRLLCLGLDILSFLWWPFFKLLKWFLAARFPSSPSIPPLSIRPDDGRYDYGLSQPVYDVIFEKNVEIPVRDGRKLRGDIFRPNAPGKFPVIMAEAPYPRYLNVLPGVDDNGGVKTRFQQFEQANPDYWVPRGYVYISFNTSGYGGSQGCTGALDFQEIRDYYDAIEWAASQPWSNGNVGLFGISWYAMSQYWVAGLHPPHLKAIVPWEGLTDPYRDIAYRGGILSRFGFLFGVMLQLIANNPFVAKKYLKMLLTHPYFDEIWEYGMSGRSPDNPGILALHLIEVPMLSVGNLGDPDLHLRGNVNAFVHARSPKKKLVLYSGTHWGSAYQPWANRMVLRFFDHYLKGVDTGIDKEPAVDVHLRTGSNTFTHVYGNTWPLENTQWVKLYLDARDRTLKFEEPTENASVKAEWRKDPVAGSSRQVTFLTEPLPRDIALVGPLVAHLWISTLSQDVDLTVEVRDFDEKGRETRFGYVFADSPDEPVTRGWLRASMRALDPERSKPHQPFYLFKRNDWLTPGVPVAVDVEIWPTAMLFKAGHRIGLTIHCGPYKRKGEAYSRRRLFSFLSSLILRGSMYQSFSPKCKDTFIHTGPDYLSWLELPVIPPDPTPTHQIIIQDNGFIPERVTGNIGDRFEWTNVGEDYHSVTESSGLNLWDSQLIRGKRSHYIETWWTKIPWAGTFEYRDMVSGMRGTIEIPDRIVSITGAKVEVELGTLLPPDGVGFDVQLQVGDGDWRTIREGIRDLRITITDLSPGTYAIRSRLHSLDPAKTTCCTGWSPPVKFKV
ncbi:MAG: CocE/NonD family hydrolase [Candidatus Jordarchaeales archaeon]